MDAFRCSTFTDSDGKNSANTKVPVSSKRRVVEASLPACLWLVFPFGTIATHFKPIGVPPGGENPKSGLIEAKIGGHM